MEFTRVNRYSSSVHESESETIGRQSRHAEQSEWGESQFTFLSQVPSRLGREQLQVEMVFMRLGLPAGRSIIVNIILCV